MGVNHERYWKVNKKPSRYINKKLADAIVDALPFDIDPAKAREIVCVIFDTIAKGLKEDRAVTINYFGKFYGKWIPPRRVPIMHNEKGKKPKQVGMQDKPGYYSTRFLASVRFRKSVCNAQS